MDTIHARRILDVVTDVRRQALEEHEELAHDEAPLSAEAADANWVLLDRPFINELCLMLMVWLRHELERELVKLVARKTSDGKDLTQDQYWQAVDDWQEDLRRDSSKWKTVTRELELSVFSEEMKIMEALKRVSNLYKHSPWTTPDEDLLSHLQELLAAKDANGRLQPYAVDLLARLKTGTTGRQKDLQPAQPLAESPDLMRALAAILDLDTEPTDYCAIVEALLTMAGQFLGDVRTRASGHMTWSKVRPNRMSLDPAKFSR